MINEPIYELFGYKLTREFNLMDKYAFGHDLSEFF